MIRQQVHTVGTTSPASPLPWQSWMMSCIRVLVTQCCMFHQPRLQNVSHIAAPLRGSVCCRASSLTQPRAFSGSLGHSGRDPGPSHLPCTLHILCGGWRGDSHLTTDSIQVCNCYVAIKLNQYFESSEILYPHLTSLYVIFTICWISVISVRYLLDII